MKNLYFHKMTLHLPFVLATIYKRTGFRDDVKRTHVKSKLFGNELLKKPTTKHKCEAIKWCVKETEKLNKNE